VFGEELRFNGENCAMRTICAEPEDLRVIVRKGRSESDMPAGGGTPSTPEVVRKHFENFEKRRIATLDSE
jgi:hypothetical protein